MKKLSKRNNKSKTKSCTAQTGGRQGGEMEDKKMDIKISTMTKRQQYLLKQEIPKIGWLATDRFASIHNVIKENFRYESF